MYVFEGFMKSEYDFVVNTFEFLVGVCFQMCVYVLIHTHHTNMVPTIVMDCSIGYISFVPARMSSVMFFVLFCCAYYWV